MKKFEFNESGTCVNPDIAFDISSLIPPSVKLKFRIKVASQNGVWNYGYELEYASGGAYGGINFSTEYRKKPFYENQKKAVIACLDEFIGYSYFPQAYLYILKDYRNTLLHEQLSLF